MGCKNVQLGNWTSYQLFLMIPELYILTNLIKIWALMYDKNETLNLKLSTTVQRTQNLTPPLSFYLGSKFWNFSFSFFEFMDIWLASWWLWESVKMHLRCSTVLCILGITSSYLWSQLLHDLYNGLHLNVTLLNIVWYTCFLGTA